MTFVVRRPKKPDEKEAKKEKHTCHSDKDGEKDTVCKVTETDVANTAADDAMELTRSALEKNWKHALKKPYETPGGNDSVTEGESLDSCKIRKESATNRCRTTGRQTQ